jgi:hypothetical protein
LRNWNANTASGKNRKAEVKETHSVACSRGQKGKPKYVYCSEHSLSAFAFDNQLENIMHNKGEHDSGLKTTSARMVPVKQGSGSSLILEEDE